MITIAKKLSFSFLMLGKHLELCDRYPKARSYDNNSKCAKTEMDSQNKDEGKKRGWGEQVSDTVMARKCVI